MSDFTESVQVTLWSPGFRHVLNVLSMRYRKLSHEATHNPTLGEKQHFSTVQQLSLIRSIVSDIYNVASEEPPESIKSLMEIGATR